ncbi:MAG: molybdopterin synthase sulfur carrier subunit [Rhodospirillaceae bacterium]|nr:molybdopterin synthase sulfur carrier subunit [Rhodospirillaceae bacterium]
MARVILTSGLGNQFCGGETEFNIDAADVRSLLTLLEVRFPGIKPELEREMAVAIDGEIYQDPFLEKIASDSEVYFLPRVGGG